MGGDTLELSVSASASALVGDGEVELGFRVSGLGCKVQGCSGLRVEA